MKFTISHNAFSEAIKAVGNALNAREANEIFRFVRIDADADGKVHVMAQNSTYLVNRVIEAKEVAEEGTALVEGSKLCRLVSMLPKEEVKVSTSNHGLRLKAGGSQSTLLCRDESDIVRHPNVSPGSEIQADGGAFCDAIRRMRYARGTGSAALWMTGEQIIAHPSGMLFATCMDGFRLGTCRIPCTVQEETTIIIPGEAIEAICELTEENDTELEIYTDGKRMICLTGKGSVNTVLLAGQWPEWKKFFPLSNQIKFRVQTDGSALRKAAERAEVLCGATKLVRLVLGDDTLSITSRGAEGSFEEAVPASIERQDESELEIALNVKYLLQALSSVGSGEIRLEMTGPISPMVIAPMDEKQEKHLILPVRITEE